MSGSHESSRKENLVRHNAKELKQNLYESPYRSRGQSYFRTRDRWRSCWFTFTKGQKKPRGGIHQSVLRFIEERPALLED